MRVWISVLMAACTAVMTAQEGPARLALDPKMIVNESGWGNPGAIVDEQDAIGDPPKSEAKTAWETDYRHAKEFPIHAHIDLGEEKHLASLSIYDINASGDLVISIGKPGAWRKHTTYTTDAYKRWVSVPLDVTTRYLRLTRTTPGCQFAEIALYAYTPQQWNALQARKTADAQANAEKAAAIAKAKDQVARRPVIDLADPFGKATLVDEIDCATDSHLFSEYPAGASKVDTLLGQPARTLSMRSGEASYLSWRIGRFKLLKPGAAYVLSVEYPQDAPRSMVVMNGGCETSRGFHTGNTTGDTLRAKYVWSNPQSLKLPLSGKWEAWQELFFLHDRFPEKAFIRGASLRKLTPDDGFPVTIAQFSAENDPPSRGIAVRRIRLYEIVDPAALKLPLPELPRDLPRRHISWREEMADGVIDSAKPEERGIAAPLDWYRHKAALMHFLGVNTFSKDLLEFGACQHWDPTDGGGNNWVFFNGRMKDLWGQIVGLMGKEGFEVLPYYEYAGSKGSKGLGNQRRAKPLKRDDAYTHIKWVESSNADLTDPATLADFTKMLDHTVVRFKEQAKFTGVWIRPRMQLPIGFGEGALARFAQQANGGTAVTRPQLASDKALLARYYTWWFEQRRAFLEGVRDHLRKNGVNPEAVVLFTADASEPGVSLPGRKVVTDDVEATAPWLKPIDEKERPITAISLQEVIQNGLHLKALQTPPGDWGGWEWTHASPAADPQRYQQTAGVMMTHGFNHAYTVSAPASFEAFASPAGLAIIRHYPLNENMMFDKTGKDLLGYFVADMEHAGPACMMAEALAVAHGDPTHIGYLSGNSYNRGFAQHVRQFNANFLALPALPSRRLENAASDAAVVVREIATEKHGKWLAIVNTSPTPRDATVKTTGKVSEAVSGRELVIERGGVKLHLAPFELRTLRVE